MILKARKIKLLNKFYFDLIHILEKIKKPMFQNLLVDWGVEIKARAVGSEKSKINNGLLSIIWNSRVDLPTLNYNLVAFYSK